jgi:hypothetical protein
MGREVRRVPAHWEHPKQNGRYIPHHDHFPYTQVEIAEGLREGWLTDNPPFYGVKVMPQWSEEERTHYQMYETTSEGTPISPVMPTGESLARWLADNNANAFAGTTASYDEWLRMIRKGVAPSFVVKDGVGMSGVAAA